MVQVFHYVRMNGNIDRITMVQLDTNPEHREMKYKGQSGIFGVGNWRYAGTLKFVSHAVTDDIQRTKCGLVVDVLMARKSQQWEAEYFDDIGCLRCRKRIRKEQESE